MSSGVKVSKEASDTFLEMKSKLLHSYYVLFKINDAKTEIVVDHTHEGYGGDESEMYYVPGEKEEVGAYTKLCEKLKEAANNGDCRYAAFDFNFKLANGLKKSKIVFVAWSPENASIKQKMVYTSSKGYIKKAVGAEVDLQATDDNELCIKELYQRAIKHLKS